MDTPAGDLNHDGHVGAEYVKKPLSIFPTYAYEMMPLDPSKGFVAQTDEAHFYKECSGAGTCDRVMGECTCFAGYTGSACQRSAFSFSPSPLSFFLPLPFPRPAIHSPLLLSPSLPAATCPNDCSGQGICRTLREVAAGALSRRAVGSTGGNLVLEGVRTPFDYSLWDADKHQMCVCDSGFAGSDCSERTCPRGDDPLTPVSDKRWCGGATCAWEVQEFSLGGSAGDVTLAFTFVDTRNATHVAYATVDTATNAAGLVNDPETELAWPTTNAGLIMASLRAVPGGLLQSVEVSGYSLSGNALTKDYRITFVGLSGDQYPMTIDVASGKGSVTKQPVEVTKGNREDYECSGRGLCDKKQSLCNCAWEDALSQPSRPPSPSPPHRAYPSPPLAFFYSSPAGFSGYYGVACEHQNALASSASSSTK